MNKLITLNSSSRDPVMQLTQEQVNYCMECGVCTGSCPVSKELPEFSPRRIIKRAFLEPSDDFLQCHEIWACLTCARCSERCPVEIDFPKYLKSFRQKAKSLDNKPTESHHGVFQSIVSLQDKGLKQNKTAWARESGRIKDQGQVYFFTGCLPYYDVFFRYLDLAVLDSGRSALKLLNSLGIEPVLRDEERCCGHDAYWAGDLELFKRLAAFNIELIQSTGASKVLFSCPEGYAAFRNLYPEHFGSLPFQVQHLTEFLAEQAAAGELSFSPAQNGGGLTFQDPCRLGRMSDVFQAPRQLLQAVPETVLHEMDRTRENAQCCGTSAWMECSSCSRAMQLERLREARASGAKNLITACPKCQIHLTCAKQNTSLDLQVTDLFTYLAERLNT